MTTKTYALQSSANGRNARLAAPETQPINTLAGRDLCSIRDLSAVDVRLILDTAHTVKAHPGCIVAHSTRSSL